MADASAVTPPTGLGGDPGFQNTRAALNALLDYDLPMLRYRADNVLFSGLTIGVAISITDTANGAFRLLSAVAFKVGGAMFIKAGSAATKVWDLSAEAAVGAASWRGYRLFLTSGGTASFTSTADTSSSAAAFTALDYLALDPTKAVIGDFAAAPSTSFSADSLSGVSGAVLRNGFGQAYSFRSFPVRW